MSQWLYTFSGPDISFRSLGHREQKKAVECAKIGFSLNETMACNDDQTIVVAVVDEIFWLGT